MASFLAAVVQNAPVVFDTAATLSKIDALTAHNTERIAVLEKAQFTLAGRQGGASQTIIWIFGGLAALSTTLTIIILIATKFLNG